MDVVEEIRSARDLGVVHCGLSSKGSTSIPELAAEFGLCPDPGVYKEIDAAAARRLLQSVLHQDMAYNSEIIPLPRAVELADRFLDQFGAEGVRLYTNGTFHEEPGPGQAWSCAGWDPATAATFDTGVLVIGPKLSGCLWVEDED